MEFKTKSAEELKNMDAVKLQAYYTEKLTHEKSELEARVKALEGMKEDSEEYKKKSIEVKEATEAKIETLLEAVKIQGIVIEKVKSGEFAGERMADLEGSIEKALKANADNFAQSKSGRHAFKFDIKAVGDMTFTNNVTGTMPQAQRLEGVNDIAERVAVVYNMTPKLTTSGNTIEWVFESNQEGSAGGTAEAASKNQVDNNFTVTSISLNKRTAYFKLSSEMLDDISFLSSWIRNKLIVRLFLDIDQQVLDGDGAGANLNGIITQATAFAAGTFANTVDNANDVDSLVVGINQIKIANQGISSLTIFMHPSDVTGLKLTKLTTTDKRYLARLMEVASSMSLDGTRIVETTAVTVGDFLIADMSKAMVVEKGGITVDVGLDGNDFTKNMRTILAEWRGEVLIQTNETTSFVTGTFATTNAALETP